MEKYRGIFVIVGKKVEIFIIISILKIIVRFIVNIVM